MTPPPPSSPTVNRNVAFVYLLQSLKDGKFYLGWTTNLQRRIQKHNEGLVNSTKTRRPFQLAGFEVLSSVEEAKNRERALKRNPNMLFHFKKRVMNSRLSKMRSLRERKEVVG